MSMPRNASLGLRIGGMLLATLAGALTPTDAGAADGVWSSTSGGNYANSANWFDAQMPDAAGRATFNSNASYQVDWTASAANDTAYFAAPGGTVTLNIGSGNTWALTNALALGTNAGGRATISVSSGTLAVTNVTIGSTVGTGTLAQTAGLITAKTLVNNAGSVITNAGGVMVVSSNMTQLGSLYVTGGGVVSNRTAITTMYGATNIVSGAGSKWVLTNGLANSVASKPGTFFLIEKGAQLLSYGPAQNVGTFTLQGVNPSGTADKMLITDPGTLVTLGRSFNCGQRAVNSGPSCSCVVSNQAGLAVNMPASGDAFNIGYGDPALLLVTGAGSYVRVTGGATINIGGNSKGSALEVRSGGSWTNTSKHSSGISMRLSYTSSTIPSNSRILIVDSGSSFYSAGDLFIPGDLGDGTGSASTNNSLTVSNSASATFGGSVNMITNKAGNTRNYVAVYDGAKLAVSDFIMAGNSKCTNNWLLVSGGSFSATNAVVISGGKMIVTNNGAVAIGKLLTLTNGAQSTLDLASGSVTNGGMVVGDGALVSVGAGGYLRVTNNFVNTAGASTVKFVASQTAVGRIKVDGIWSNSATALLNVNLTGYTGGWPVTLATFSSASPATPYAAENITVTGGGGGVTIKQTATQIQVAKVTGAVILVR